MVVARTGVVTLDCAEPGPLAEFWAAMLEAGVPKQLHLDLAVTDLDAAQSEAQRLGAAPAAVQPAPDRRRVLLDPAGHPFCLTTQIPPAAFS
jgi:hypothetical protein